MEYFKHVAGVGDVPMTPEEVAAWEAEQAQNNKPNVDEQIKQVPENLFGGPDLKEIFNGN